MVRVFRVSQNSYIFALDFPPVTFCGVQTRRVCGGKFFENGYVRKFF